MWGTRTVIGMTADGYRERYGGWVGGHGSGAVLARGLRRVNSRLSRRAMPRDFFGFEDSTAIPDEVHAADDKTLRLSSVEISDADVEAFLQYQRALRDDLEFSPVCRAGWVEHLAEAHRRALLDAGLDAARHSRLAPIAADFCGKRMTVRRLRRRLAELNDRIARHEAGGANVSAQDREL